MENTLLEHPAVQEVGVVGVPIEGLLRVKAVTVLANGYPASADLSRELQEWCKGRLQRYQYPHQVEFVSELPKTVTGKVQRYQLRWTEPR